VADEPPPDLVDALAKVFRDSDGDLALVSTALIENDRAWSTPATKIRNPSEFVLAAKRAIGNMPNDPGQILGVVTRSECPCGSRWAERLRDAALSGPRRSR